MISKPMEHSAYTMFLSWVKISAMSKRTKMNFHLSLVTSEYHRIRPKWLLCLWYIWCKSCTYLALTLTLSPNGPTQDLTRPTSLRGFHRVHPKWFLSLWYDLRKPCTYLASRLALYPNGPKEASTWASSPWSTIGCGQNDFWSYGTFGTNRAPILLRH
jgi:hypothetical protein